MKKKLFIIGGIVAAVAALVVALIFIFTGGEDAYRSIKVFEIDGSCKVERDGDTLDAFKNMALSSGDSLSVGDGSFARLKLDDDKFVYLEANTKINLTATGTAKNSKTMVYIESGSMLTEVKRKLSATSSYDIVTPNTTMSIRGTKTLTEVYKDVLGAIKTNAAVVEGQVSFKTIQKDSTGKAVVVTTELGVGQGLGVTTDSKDLLSMDDVKHIADDGKTADGQDAKETTHEELGTVLETPVFSEEFLTNIVAVLARSQQEDIDEGFVTTDGASSDNDTTATVTSEDLDAAINVLNDVIDGKLVLPPSVEEYVINYSQSYYDTPIVNDTPVTDDGGNGGTLQTDESVPEQDGDETIGDVIGDDDQAAEENADDQAENGDDDTEDAKTPDGEDDSPEGDDDEKKEEGESEEERIAREEKERLEKEEAERLEKEEQEKKEKEEKERLEKEEQEEKEKEEKERLEKEEQEKKEKEEKERLEKEEKEKKEKEEQEKREKEAQEQAEREEAERIEREEAERIEREEAERLAREQAEQEAQQSQGGGSGASQSVSFSYGSTTAYIRSSSGSTPTPVTLTFYEVRSAAGSQTSERRDIEQGALPTTLTVGAALPGTENSTIHVELDSSVAQYYEFVGWYSSESGAMNLTSSELVTTAQSGNMTLYPGIKLKTYTVEFVNLFPEAGRLVLPTSGSSPITYETNDNRVIATVPANVDLTLPKPMNEASAARDAVLHIEGADYLSGYPIFRGVGVGQSGSTNAVPGDCINLARILLEDQLESTAYIDSLGASFIGYTGNTQDEYNNPITLESNMTFYLYFGVSVSLSVPEKVDSGETIKMVKTDGSTGTVENALSECGFNSSNDSAQIIRLRQDTQHTDAAQKSGYDQYWLAEFRGGSAADSREWFFNTYYFGKPLDVPSFESPVTGEDLYARYAVTGANTSLMNNILYTNRPVSGKTSADTSFCGSGAQSFPFNKYKNAAGQLQFYDMSMFLSGMPYAILDLSEEGLSVEIGEGYDNIIRTPGDNTGRQYEVIIQRANDNYRAFVPEDGIYEWSSGGQLRTSTSENASSQFFVSKTGYRLAGYTVTSYNWISGAQIGDIQRCAVNKNLIDQQDTIYTTIYEEDNLTAFTVLGQNLGKKYVVKPVFVPADKPFEVKLTRTPGKIVKTSWTSEKGMADYQIEISGLEMVGAFPYITQIDLWQLAMDCYYPTYNLGEYMAQTLGTFFEWNTSKNAYVLRRGDDLIGNESGYSISNGKVSIPLLDFYDFALPGHTSGEYHDADFVRGYAFSENIQVPYFRFITYLGGDGHDCMAGAGATTPTTFAEYCPCKANVGLPENSEAAFTATYFWGEITSIFSEANDTIENPLQTFSGKTGDDVKDVWYGGIFYNTYNFDYDGYALADPDDQTAQAVFEERNKWVINRTTTGGPAWKAVKGNVPSTEVLGSGVLILREYCYIYTSSEAWDAVKIYNQTGKSKIDANQLSSLEEYQIDKDGYVDGTCGEDQYILLCPDEQCADGWIKVQKQNEQHQTVESGYIYCGDNTDVRGRLSAENIVFDTNIPN